MARALYNRRWYDQKNELSRCIGLVEVFPQEIQSVVAQGMITLAENEFHAREAMSTLRSLGPEVVLGVYKSKNKRRSHDENELLHQALNYFYILGLDNQIKLAAHVTQVVRHIYAYLDTCNRHRRQPQIRDIVDIKNAFVFRGVDEAQRVTQHLQARIADGTPSPRIQYKPDVEVISEGDSGMQVKKNDD